MLPTEDTNGDSLAVTSNGNGTTNGLPPIKKLKQTDKDIIRIIGQHLIDLGFNESAQQLIIESGCEMEQPLAKVFRQHILNGRWDKAEISLKSLSLHLGHEIDYKEMLFLVLEQKYLEYLERGDVFKALECLRHQLTPLDYKTKRVYQLSSFVMCSGTSDLLSSADWAGTSNSRVELMVKLQEFFPASVMLAPGRLITLLRQAVTLQKDRCPYHNARPKSVPPPAATSSSSVSSSSSSSSSSDMLKYPPPRSTATIKGGIINPCCAPVDEIDDISLLTDHICSKADFPCERLQTLTDHTDEVWFCRFSPNGQQLATGSKDGNMLIWNINEETRMADLEHTCEGHTLGVSFIAWSPDSLLILALGPDESSDVNIWNSMTGELKAKVNHSQDDSLTSASWHEDGRHFVVGGTRGQFYLSDINGHFIDSWEGVRIQSVACIPDNVNILAADTHYRIRCYNFDSKDDPKIIIQEDHPIMSFTLNKDASQALLNVATKGIHLWDIKDKVILQKFQGVTQGYFTNHSCFGGINQCYVASGSEDNNIYIWQSRSEHPIAMLSGHRSNVNCVHWNPVFPDLLASASDDGTVRLWAPAELVQQETTDNLQ